MALLEAAAPARDRTATTKRFLLCRPDYFDVEYVINPWMHTAAAVDRARAGRQWEALAQAYRDAGHLVDVLDAAPGLPDMVFAANSALVIDGRAFTARFRHHQRAGEEKHYRDWLHAHGVTDMVEAEHVNEGEGDFALAGEVVLAATGFRTDRRAHAEVAACFEREVVSLHLVDPRFYHLDTALAVLDDRPGHVDVMYFPGAFSVASRRRLRALFPDALLATEADALAFGLNATSDGRRVFLAAGATALARRLEARGYEPVRLDVSELLKAGGGVKCCTLELRAPVPSALARNYHPLPVTVAEGEGAWVRDGEGHAYLDFLSAYSALNFGHRHPRLVAAAHRQLDRVTLVSRAFDSDLLEPFARELAALCGKEAVLPMNTGAEAVETAIKAVRRWGYTVKGVPADQALIIVCDGNFHGRTTTIVGMSDDPSSSEHFGPFAPGFVRVPFGDAPAMAEAIERDASRVVAVLVEPIQGEAGVVVPPAGYLAAVRRLCSANDVLFVADEIQSGLGRTGATFACDHDDVVPDLYVLGKALGGGIVPVSAVVGDWEVLGVFEPGTHGSTFGGNPLACAVGREVVAMLATGEPQARAAHLGAQLHARLAGLPRDAVAEVRGRGLWAGVELAPHLPSGRATCEALLRRGVLAKETHGRTVRLAPPIVIDAGDLDWGLDQLEAVVAAGAQAG